ncbi:hypothetical protein RO3G_08709 [Lichtheimia corymbifera JMRC:FSU:9682]|uniref:WD40 repeat-like protein n=1 Tax=Lichtheimia corymbifera JMRC:FSU:9682 TaxID=1263082 RepID=A0A068RRT3_9FUNG|nr:hypothetical protein RO3G_08709 [Lichtheimia corymbifera JMRC:FSU:9682]
MDRKPRRIAPNDATQSHLSADALDSLEASPIRFIPYTMPAPARTTSTRAPPPVTASSRPLESVFGTTAMTFPIPPNPHANPSLPARFPVAFYMPPQPQPPASQPPPQRLATKKSNDDDLIVISSDEEDAMMRNKKRSRPKGKSMQDAINLDDEEDDVDIVTVSPSPASDVQRKSTAITIDDDEEEQPKAQEAPTTEETKGQQQDQSTSTTTTVTQLDLSSTTTTTPASATPSTSTLYETALPDYPNPSPSSSSSSMDLETTTSEELDNGDQSSRNVSVDKAGDSLRDNLSATPMSDSQPPSTETADTRMNQDPDSIDIKQEEQRAADLATMPLLQPKIEESQATTDNLATSSASPPPPTTKTADQQEDDDDSVASAELLFESTTSSPASKLDIDLMYALNASEMDNSNQPDWSALAKLSIQDDTETTSNININNIPTLEELTLRPIATAISLKDDGDDENRVIEMLSHIDAYDLSLDSLVDKATTISASVQPTSSIRNGSKRRKTNSTNGPPPAVLKKPYVPTHVWTHTTWEDWAQLQVGDWLHWPFETWEIQRIQRGVDHYNKKKLPIHNIKPEVWQILADQLPGRRPEDCKRYWCDHESDMVQPYISPVIIGKGKGRSEKPSQFDLVQGSRINNHFRVASARKVLWSELNYHDSFGDGSADAIALQVIKSRRQRGLKVVVASACNDQPEYNMPGNLRLWSADTRKITQLPFHRTEVPQSDGTQYMWHTVTDVRVSVDQRFIYSSSHDKSARVWDSRSGKMLSTLVFHEKQIHQLAVSPDKTEHILASGSADGTAVIWRLKAGGNVGSGTVCDMSAKMPAESKDRVSIDTLAFGTGPSAGKLFTGVVTGLAGADDPAGFVQVYDASNGKGVLRLTSMTAAVCDIDVSSTGKFIASANYGSIDGQMGDGYIHIHDIRAPQVAILAKTGHTDVNVVRMSPCERYVASGSPDNETAILDIRKPNEPIFRLRHERRADNGRLEAPNSDMGIAGVYWMSNTRQLLTGGGDASVKLWDIWGNGEMVRSYETSSNVTSLAVDEDSMVICAGVAGSQGYVHMFTGAPL